MCGMSVLRWMIPPVFLFYLGCEPIHIYTREILSAECPIRRYRYAVYSVQFRSELRHSLEESVLVSRFDRREGRKPDGNSILYIPPAMTRRVDRERSNLGTEL